MAASGLAVGKPMIDAREGLVAIRRFMVFATIAALVIAAITLAHAHDHYTDWMRPDTGTSCCNETDCYPTSAQFKSGSWWALRREDSAWVKIPDAKILKNQSSPDGKAHLCATAANVYCFVIPESGA